MRDIITTVRKYAVKLRYLTVFVFFTVWIVFIDQTNLIYKSKLKDNIEYLKNKKEFYKEEIAKNEKYYKNLTSNPDAKERLAREEYYMHKDNEEVFIIVDEAN